MHLFEGEAQRSRFNELSGKVIGAGIEFICEWAPGFFEGVYKKLFGLRAVNRRSALVAIDTD